MSATPFDCVLNGTVSPIVNPNPIKVKAMIAGLLNDGWAYETTTVRGMVKRNIRCMFRGNEGLTLNAGNWTINGMQPMGFVVFERKGANHYGRELRRFTMES